LVGATSDEHTGTDRRTRVWQPAVVSTVCATCAGGVGGAAGASGGGATGVVDDSEVGVGVGGGGLTGGGSYQGAVVVTEFEAGADVEGEGHVAGFIGGDSLQFERGGMDRRSDGFTRFESTAVHLLGDSGAAHDLGVLDRGYEFTFLARRAGRGVGRGVRGGISDSRRICGGSCITFGSSRGIGVGLRRVVRIRRSIGSCLC